MVKTISATELKRRVAEVLNDVYFYKKTIVITRYGKPIAKIIHYRETGRGEY